jgi:hypothetical protein
MEHTKEPWFVEVVTKPNGDKAIGIYTDEFDVVNVTLRKVIRKIEDAERIVACVNACAGYDNPEMMRLKAEAYDMLTDKMRAHVPFTDGEEVK